MLIIVAVLLALIVVRFFLPAGTPAIRGGTGKSIAVLEKVHLGGSDQWILERSEDVDNPLILFLHGGPGTSQLTSNRRDTRGLEKHFIVVNWDQRGAGKSYGAIRMAGKMNIDQFVEDTRELTLFLMQKFRKVKIILAGHSWGSVIGLLTVSKYPELFDCYIGIGQLANMAEGEAASYRWTLEQAKRANDHGVIRALEKMRPPPYTGDWRAKTVAQRRYLGKYGGEWHGSKSGAFGHVLKSLLISREYTLVDRMNYFRGIFGSMKLLWPQLMEVNLFETVPEVRLPIFFMEGRFDHECPSEIAARYFEALEAPSKDLVWFERSAHLPNAEERELFNRAVVEKVLPVCLCEAGS
jgi:pimeloyl-ACP methyl ester carboxylesterase